MRVIAGAYKGRRLAAPTWPGLRPTSDRLKESVFAILAPAVAGARVLDGFAGSGALGIEALSRGAASVVFVDEDARAAALIERNLAHCRIAEGYVMIRAEFTRALRQLAADRRFDLALLDPPYDVANLAAVVDAAAGRMAPGGVMVLEHASRRQAPPAAAGFASGPAGARRGQHRDVLPRGAGLRARDGGPMSTPRERVAVYPGSFDPLTNGHVDIILRGARLFDRIIVAILRNAEKQPLFTLEERESMAREVFREYANVEVEAFDGLLVDYAAARGASAIVRGLRAVSDFEFELQMALMNRRLGPDIETVFMMPAEQYTYVSSRLIKEVFSLGGQVAGLVPEVVEQHLREKRAKI